MKSEPGEFSIDDLAKNGREFWDGVRNYQVRNMFRDEFSVGDKALFYHSNCSKIGVVGEMKVIQEATTDKTQFDSKNKHFDPKSTKSAPRWLGVTVEFVSKFKHTVSLDKIKEIKLFSDSPLVKKGNRLSVMKLSKKQYDKIVQLGSK